MACEVYCRPGYDRAYEGYATRPSATTEHNLAESVVGQAALITAWPGGRSWRRCRILILTRSQGANTAIPIWTVIWWNSSSECQVNSSCSRDEGGCSCDAR